jgi:hypothetical protein
MQTSPNAFRQAAYRLYPDGLSQCVVVDESSRLVAPVSNPTGSRIAYLLDDAAGLLRQRIGANCHGAAAYVLGEVDRLQAIGPVMPAGEVLTLESAGAAFEYPFRAQLVNAEPGGVSVVHTAVILAPDNACDTHVVFHKPGKEPYELCGWQQAIRRYCGLYKELLFSGRKRK